MKDFKKLTQTDYINIVKFLEWKDILSFCKVCKEYYKLLNIKNPVELKSTLEKVVFLHKTKEIKYHVYVIATMNPQSFDEYREST